MKNGLRKGYDFPRLSKTYAMLFISSVTNMASYSGDSKLFLHYLQVSRNPVLLHDFAVLIDIKGILKIPSSLALSGCTTTLYSSSSEGPSMIGFGMKVTLTISVVNRTTLGGKK